MEVGALVFSEVGGVIESAVAEHASEGALACVDAGMTTQHRGLSEAFATDATVVGPLPCVYPLVVSHV